MAYLVTGGTGFLGSYVVRDLLNAGKEVVCLQRSGVTQTLRDIVGEDKVGKIKVIQGDVSNAMQVFNIIKENKIDLIVHLGYVLAPVSELEPAYALQVNCTGLVNLLEAIRLFGLRRLVWTSSSRAFGCLGEIWREPVGGDNALYMPDDLYGATKVLNEYMLKHYYAKFKVDSIGIRMARTFGTGKWSGGGVTLTRFFQSCALNIPAVIGGANQITPYQYVEDTSELVLKACEVETTKSRIFNTGEELTITQLVDIIRKINPQAQVTVEERRDVGPVFVPANHPRVDITTTKTELGWEPKYSIEGGLRKMFNYFRKEKGLPLL